VLSTRRTFSRRRLSKKQPTLANDFPPALKAGRLSPIGDNVSKAWAPNTGSRAVLDGMMDKLVWTEQYRIGIKKIDDQHRELFSIVNQLIDSDAGTAPTKIVQEVVFRVSGYAGYHFRTEEEIMRQYGYPGYAAQANEHAAFRIKAAQFCGDAIAGKSGLLTEMRDYLTEWLSRHILESDLQFKRFLIDNGFSPDAS
jgi:hemerythrin